MGAIEAVLWAAGMMLILSAIGCVVTALAMAAWSARGRRRRRAAITPEALLAAPLRWREPSADERRAS